MFKIGDKVLVENYSLHKDDYFYVIGVVTDDDYIGKTYYFVDGEMNIFFEKELTLYETPLEALVRF